MRRDGVALAVAIVVAACSRSGLDASGGIGEDAGVSRDATASPGDEGSTATGDDVTAATPIDATPGAASDGYSAGGGDAVDEGRGPESGAPSDAAPEIPCLERTVVNCDCDSDVCESQRIRLQDAILNVGGCIACLQSYFTFDVNGCVTGYSHPEWRDTTHDACLLQQVGGVRFSCTAGVTQPFGVYHSCTVPM
jgi:hypothetical protein